MTAGETTSLIRDLLHTHPPSVIWTVDPDLRVTSWNGDELMPSGESQGSVIGRLLSEVFRTNGIVPDSLEMHKQALAGVSSDFRMTASDRDFLVNVSPLRQGSDRIIGVVGVASEIIVDGRKPDRRLRQAKFDRVLSAFLGHAVRHQFDDGFYQRLVAAALEMVPEAQAGSFWLPTEADRLKAVATVGLGHEAVGDSALTAEEIRQSKAGRHSPNGVDPSPAATARATLSVPVKVQGEAEAFLFIHSFEKEDAFDEDAHKFMQLFATELEALFQHADLRRALREERRTLEQLLEAYKALAKFGAEIETIRDAEELIQHGMKRLLEAFQFDAATFGEVRGDRIVYTRLCGAATGELARTLETPQPLGAGANGRVAVSGEPLFVEDYSSWSSRYEPFVAAGVVSLLVLPIRRNGRVLHTLSFTTINRFASIDENMVHIASGFAKRLENAFERTHNLAEIASTREATFRLLGIALEFRDLETRGHTDRVVELSNRFADVMNLGNEQRQALTWGAYLHDLGKIAVPDAILLKPGRLTEAEFSVIKKHTLFGIEMLKDIPFLPAATREVVRSHHERWDGSGYPDQLVGNGIPLFSRMFALVDVYDALTSERPYKRAWTHEEAVSELEEQAGAQFDPDLTTRFLESIGKEFTQSRDDSSGCSSIRSN